MKCERCGIHAAFDGESSKPDDGLCTICRDDERDPRLIREGRICRAIAKRSDDYRLQAARVLLDAGLGSEGETMEADEVPVVPIPGEIPGAWVPVYVWVNARDLPPKGPRRA